MPSRHGSGIHSGSTSGPGGEDRKRDRGPGKHRGQLEEMCKMAFGSGGLIMESSETRKFHQGVRLSGFDGARFVLSPTHDKEEDWKLVGDDDELAQGIGSHGGSGMTIAEAQRRVRALELKRRTDAEASRLLAAEERTRTRRAKLKRVFDKFDYDGVLFLCSQSFFFLSAFLCLYGVSVSEHHMCLNRRRIDRIGRNVEIREGIQTAQCIAKRSIRGECQVD